METGKKNPVFAQTRDDPEVVVFEGVPEIPELSRKEAEPGAGVRSNIGARFVRPIPRDFRAFQSSTRGGFGLVNRVSQHLTLTRMKTGKGGIAGRLRIISEPEIDAAMRGKEDRVAGNKIIVKPARRRADEDAQEKHPDGNPLRDDT